MEGCGVTESYLRVDCKMQHLHNHQCLQGNVLNISIQLTYKLMCQVMLCCMPSFITGLTSLRDDPMTIVNDTVCHRVARLIFSLHER